MKDPFNLILVGSKRRHDVNAGVLLAGLRHWFEDYVIQFSSDEPMVQASMDLKVDHTRKVCDAIVDIGKSLNLSRKDLCIAEACALLHDIGRFEQFRRYRTFSDARSEDHAALGVKVLKETRVMDRLAPATADTVLWAVGYHNRASLPDGEDGPRLFFLKLLRDADKIDIWRVVTDYYQQTGDSRNKTIELDLADTDLISDPVYGALKNGKIASIADLRTLNDFKLLQIGLIYDINFPRTFQIVQEKGYLEIIRDALPRASVRAKEIYDRARAYLDGKCAGGPSVSPHQPVEP